MPDADPLVNAEDFKVFDESKSESLDLSLPLRQQPYLVRCQNSGTTPTLHLASTIFRNAERLERENRANLALQQQNAG